MQDITVGQKLPLFRDGIDRLIGSQSSLLEVDAKGGFILLLCLPDITESEVYDQLSRKPTALVGICQQRREI